MVIGIVHDVKTKEGQLTFSARLSNNLDGKLVLPAAGDPVATLVASHRYVCVCVVTAMDHSAVTSLADPCSP